MNLLTIPMILQATPNPELNLSITRYLPHANLPLGLETNSFTMKTALDTCAGVNVGHLGYHQAVAALFPDAVVCLRSLIDAGQQIDIGGIGNGGLIITHEITYRMPMRAGGAEARITFGLSDTVQVTSLCGIGFFMKTRAVLSFSNSDDPALIVQPLGLNLPVTYETPSVRTPPTRRDVTKAYLNAPSPNNDRAHIVCAPGQQNPAMQTE